MYSLSLAGFCALHPSQYFEVLGHSSDESVATWPYRVALFSSGWRLSIRDYKRPPRKTTIIDSILLNIYATMHHFNFLLGSRAEVRAEATYSASL